MEPTRATWPRAGGPETPMSWPVGWHVEVVASTGSTNADLLDAARRGAPDRSVRVAAHQTAGRGRMDRVWEAPPGANLLVSMLFRQIPEHPHELTQRVTIAAARTARRYTSAVVVGKWPNDLLADGHKLAGILAQSGSIDGRVDHVVVGLGLNVGWAPAGAAALGPGIHPLTILADLLAAFDALPAEIEATYRSHLGTIGQLVRVHRHDGDLDGRAVDVLRDGRLVVRTADGKEHLIDTGDVIHLRPAVDDLAVDPDRWG